MLSSTSVGNRRWAGNLEVSAGDAAGRVAGGSEGGALFEALRLVRAMLTCVRKFARVVKGEI